MINVASAKTANNGFHFFAWERWLALQITINALPEGNSAQSPLDAPVGRYFKAIPVSNVGLPKLTPKQRKSHVR